MVICLKSVCLKRGDEVEGGGTKDWCEMANAQRGNGWRCDAARRIGRSKWPMETQRGAHVHARVFFETRRRLFETMPRCNHTSTHLSFQLLLPPNANNPYVFVPSFSSSTPTLPLPCIYFFLVTYVNFTSAICSGFQ